MTKAELRSYLRYNPLHNIVTLTWGQEAPIYKASTFQPGADVIYIPDLSVHGLKFTVVPEDEEELNCLLGLCFTGDDFVEECGGDIEKAERLFWYVDWQCPSSAVNEIEDDADEEDDEALGVAIYTAYSPECDMTFIMKDVGHQLQELISTEVVGWYYGQPNEVDTQNFIGRLKAEYRDCKQPGAGCKFVT